jgi:hypothetical protein
MKKISELLTAQVSVKRPTSERAYLIQEIANSIQVPYKNIMNVCWHLRGEEGNKILRIILSDVLQTGDNIWFRGRELRKMIEKSKGKIIIT